MANQNFHELLFDVCRSMRYHSRRQAFFENCDRWSDFLILLLGAGTAAAALVQQNNQILILFVGPVVAFISGLKRAFDFGVKAGRHAQFVKDFTRLEKRLRADDSDETVAAVTQEQLEIEAGEPPVKRALDVLCHNALLAATGYDDKTRQQYGIKVGWFRRLTANLFSWANTDWQKVGKNRVERSVAGGGSGSREGRGMIAAG